jgi:alanyl-tRNA synthetase
MKSSDIRQQFIDFFVSKEHTAVRSAPVIPWDDPTLLFTNAGMNQFKNIFLGLKDPDFPRAVDSQKCIRAGGKHNDLEEVGRDGYHHTFFEMLGNWSFGDYYKKEAITWAWELLTDVWKLPKNLLYATVHKSDSEAFELWKTHTDIDPTHIEYHDDKDNFWEMGETGPCGPCSEIHIDRGEQYCNLKNDPNHVCKVNGDCHRYIELWNLVFIQYNRDEEGTLHPLKHKFVDTGAGFERVCQVLQNKSSNYDTDLFMPILDAVSAITGAPYHQDDRGTSHRVIADHIRALSFALADGGLPSNDGRGYVLRRILRRAARHGRLLNRREPFLYKLVDTVVAVMGDHFSELRDKESHIKMIIKAEEERFNLTLDKGLGKFEEIIGQLKGTQISGSDAFMLYDTYGFPMDLTRILAEEKGLTIDEAGFDTEMQAQKTRAREAARFTMNIEEVDWVVLRDVTPTEFVGYDETSCRCCIQKYSIDDKDTVRLVLNTTPFYAESGGQVADTGRIISNECSIEITSVQKEQELFVHYGRMTHGEITDTEYVAMIDEEKRLSTARNHTATHLLHKALKEVLGNHVNQKGSLVQPDYLRFDFTHFQQVSQEELSMVEHIVNGVIRDCYFVDTAVKTIDEAKAEGATALFGEKYGDDVRVVTVGDFSKELCGGTHLQFTGEIGLFKILSESSIAAGVRRIEAVTGAKAEEYVNRLEDEMEEVMRLVNTPKAMIFEKLEKIIAENRELHHQMEQLKAKSAGSKLDELVDAADDVDGITLVAAKIDVADGKAMRAAGDQLRDKLSSGIGVLIADVDGKVSIIVIVTKDLTKRFNAGKIVNEVAQIVGGRGGGRPDMAQAGGKDTSKIPEAVAAVEGIIRSMA